MRTVPAIRDRARATNRASCAAATAGTTIYSEWARRSREQWLALEARHDSIPSLWHGCGVLWLAPPGDTYAADTLATLQGLRYPIELLDQAALRTRYPHLDARDIERAMVEPEGGVIMARRSIEVLTTELSRTGVRLLRTRAQKTGDTRPRVGAPR